MATRVIYGDVVASTIEYLVAGLTAHDDTASVVQRIPSGRPGRFVTVQRTGGVTNSRVTENAQVTFDAWGESPADAHDLAQLVRALVLALPDATGLDVPVLKVSEFGGPAWLPDPDSTQPRYRWSTLLLVRGVGFDPAGPPEEP